MTKRIENSPKSIRLIFGIAITLSLLWFQGETYAQVTDLPPLKESKAKPSAGSNPKAEDSGETRKQSKKSISLSIPRAGDGENYMTGVSSEDRAMIAKACRPKQYSGPIAFHACEREQAAAARNAVKASFDGVSSDDRALIAKACRPKQYSGPAAFYACERDQVVSLKNSPTPSFEGVGTADRALIAKACRAKQYAGPAAHRACQREHANQVRMMQDNNSGRKK